MRKASFWIWLLLASFFFSCNSGLKIPPVTATPTNTYTHGRFVWYDLATPNIEMAKKFYSTPLGWSFETIGEGKNTYTLIKNNNKIIGGILPLTTSANIAAGEWIGSLSVANIGDACNTALTNGGKILKNTTNIPGRGKAALIADPQGGILAFLKASSGDPEWIAADQNEWLGMELWSNDPDASEKFYSAMSNYSIERSTVANVPYRLFKKDGKLVAGLIKNPVANVRTHWVPYIRVANIQEKMSLVTAAGGKILMAPNPSVRNGSVAIITDPNGAPMALQVYE